MDHKEFAKSLSADDLAALNETADAPGLWHLAGHLGLMTGLGLWIAFGGPLWPLVMVIQGVAICFLFTLEHEATHKTPFRTLQLNEWVGRFCGVMILLPFTWFRYFHLAHHRYTNIPGKDPELEAGAKPETWSAYIRFLSGLPYWWGMARQTIGNVLGRDPGPYIPRNAKASVVTEARWML
ncbi:MAG: fatty acid desaturase, partial [Pseudomonadota bacterium]